MRNHAAGMRTRASPELLWSQAAAELALGLDGRGRPSPYEITRDGGAGSMGSECPQRADDILNLILLKQADGGYAGGSGFQARCGVFHGDTTESEDGDSRPARFPQGSKTRRGRSG